MPTDLHPVCELLIASQTQLVLRVKKLRCMSKVRRGNLDAGAIRTKLEIICCDWLQNDVD